MFTKVVSAEEIGYIPEVYTIVEDSTSYTVSSANEIIMDSDIEIVCMRGVGGGGDGQINGSSITSSEVSVTTLAGDYELFPNDSKTGWTKAYLIVGKKGQKYYYNVGTANASLVAYLTRYGIK